MGIRGHIQTTQASYMNGACISSWVSYAAYEYLTTDAGVDIHTDDNGVDADHWEIDIGDIDHLKSVAKTLHQHPDAMDKYFPEGDELIGKQQGRLVAEWLDVGIAVAEKNNYDTIQIDWF